MPILINLHWLPVIARIEYKMDLITYKALKTKYPKYLGDILQLVNSLVEIWKLDTKN